VKLREFSSADNGEARRAAVQFGDEACAEGNGAAVRNSDSSAPTGPKATLGIILGTGDQCCSVHPGPPARSPAAVAAAAARLLSGTGGGQVRDFVPGSPAYLSDKIRRGDKILQVGQQDVDAHNVVKLMRGNDAPGAQVTLRLYRPTRKRPFEVHLMRAATESVARRRALIECVGKLSMLAGASPPELNEQDDASLAFRESSAALRAMERERMQNEFMLAGECAAKEDALRDVQVGLAALVENTVAAIQSGGLADGKDKGEQRSSSGAGADSQRTKRTSADEVQQLQALVSQMQQEKAEMLRDMQLLAEEVDELRLHADEAASRAGEGPAGRNQSTGSAVSVVQIEALELALAEVEARQTIEVRALREAQKQSAPGHARAAEAAEAAEVERERADALAKELAEVRCRAEEVMAEAEAAHAQARAELEARAGELDEQLRAREEELDQTARALREAKEGAAREMEERAVAFEATVEEREAAFEKAKAELAEKESAIEEVAAQLDAEKSTSESLAQRLTELEAAAESRAAEVVELESKLEKARVELEDKTARLASLMESGPQTAAASAEARAQLVEKLEALRNELKEEKAKVEKAEGDAVNARLKMDQHAAELIEAEAVSAAPARAVCMRWLVVVCFSSTPATNSIRSPCLNTMMELMRGADLW